MRERLANEIGLVDPSSFCAQVQHPLHKGMHHAPGSMVDLGRSEPRHVKTRGLPLLSRKQGLEPFPRTVYHYSSTADAMVPTLLMSVANLL